MKHRTRNAFLFLAAAAGASLAAITAAGCGGSSDPLTRASLLQLQSNFDRSLRGWAERGIQDAIDDGELTESEADLGPRSTVDAHGRLIAELIEPGGPSE